MIEPRIDAALSACLTQSFLTTPNSPSVLARQITRESHSGTHRHHSPSARKQSQNTEGKKRREQIMSAAAAWVLPEKYTEDLKDETGEAMSKR